MEIKEEFKNLIPALSVEEYAQLEANILEEGIREPIITWNGYIIDGHNRFSIAQRFDLEYKTTSKYFSSEESVKEWMILNQFGRRNLSNYQRSVLALELEEVFKEKAKNKQGTRNDLTSSKSLEEVRTHKELEKVAQVSHETVRKVKKIQAKAPEEVKAKLATGEVSINAAYKEIKKEEKKQNFINKKIEFEKPIININTNQKIIEGDSRQVLKTLDKKSFDLLLSDPPYGMDFKSGWNIKDKIQNDKIEDTVKLFEEVLKESVPLLKDDAHFYLFGNINYMNEIKPIIEKYLTLKNVLIWDRQIIGMGDLKTYGNSYDVVYFGYNKKWKDLNGTRDRDILNFQRVDPSKNIHPTEKPLDMLQYLIKKSSKENDKILEPFAGGGSTLLACKNTNRKATGIEIENKYVELIKERI
mgnify:CR=1 FL=1